MSPSAENMSVVFAALKTKPQIFHKAHRCLFVKCTCTPAPSCLILFVSAMLVFKLQTVLQLRLLLRSGSSLPHWLTELFFQHPAHSHTCALPHWEKPLVPCMFVDRGRAGTGGRLSKGEPWKYSKFRQGGYAKEKAIVHESSCINLVSVQIQFWKERNINSVWLAK